MDDLNDVRVFERVAALGSFSKAASALAMPKSTVSRCVARLETALGIRLIQRNNRDIEVTEAGRLLHQRCMVPLTDLSDALAAVGGMAGEPRGRLRISAGIAFGINVLADLLPEFVRRYSLVDVSLHLSSEEVDFVREGFDIAIRLGPIADSALMASRLGRLPRYLCAAPSYLGARGSPASPAELSKHAAVEMPTPDGRARSWLLERGDDRVQIEPRCRISVNEAIAIHRMVLAGAGIGVISGYLCAPDLEAGRLVRVLPDWSAPAVEVSLLHPGRRDLSPCVRVFVDFMREHTESGARWQSDPYPGQGIGR